MVVFVLDKLAEFFQNEVHVFLASGKEIPTWTRLELFAKRFQLPWSIDCRIDADRDDARVFTESIAEKFLNLFQVTCNWQTTALTAREERVDDDGLALQEIAVEPHLFAVLI